MTKRRWFGLVMIVVGLALIAYPLYMDYTSTKEAKALEDAISLIAMADEGEEVDLSAIEDLPFSEEDLRNALELEIPYLDIVHRVLPETNEYNLSIALTEIKEDQKPGEGNFTIAGHRGYRDGRHFSNLSEVPIGEEIYLHVGEDTYVYEIESSEVIPPTAIEVLEDDPNKNELTLITCTISGNERVAVKAKFIEKKKRSHKK